MATLETNLDYATDGQLLQVALDAEQEMIEKVEAVHKGWASGLIISGPPGTGKSHSVKKQLVNAEGLTHTSDVFTEQDTDKNSPTFKQWFETGRITGPGPLVRKSRYAPWSLIRDLYRNREKENKLIIDDNDVALMDLDFCSILMAATEQETDREIDYTVRKITELRCEHVPDKFIYNGGVIMLTNYNMKNAPKQGGKGFQKYHERWKAIISRLAGQYVDLQMHNPRVLLAFLEHRIKETDMLLNGKFLVDRYGESISESQQNDLFNVIREVMGADLLGQDLDLRVYNAGAEYIIRDNDIKVWKPMFYRNLCKRGAKTPWND